jgi:hypothetical protein
MRGTRIDHSHRGIDDGVDGFACGGIGQAKDGNVSGIDGFGAPQRMLALVGGKRQQPQVGAAAQALMDLQPGGALVAIDENKGSAHVCLLLKGSTKNGRNESNGSPYFPQTTKIGKVEFNNDDIQLF